jgi:signal transduction histidine kinase
MNIQKKTAAIFTCITAAILLLVSCVAYVYMNAFAFQDFYKRLEIRAILTAKLRSEQHNLRAGEIYSDIRDQHLGLLPGEREIFLPADSLDIFIRNGVVPVLPAKFYADLRSGTPAYVRKGDYFYTGVTYKDAGRTWYIIVGAENTDSVRYTRKLKIILITCCLAGILAAYTSGIFFSRHTFKPVRDIIDRANTISAENLHLRLDDNGGEDEIAELAQTFNNMLSRLETAFETQNNFVSHASHEFRTPLTAIYSEADVALSRTRTSDDYRHSLLVILSQAGKLQQITDSLLNLAQTGFDGKSQNMKPVDIYELLPDVKDTINKIVPGNHVRIDMGGIPEDHCEVIVTGNYNLLKLGLTNVIENACKYSENKPVSVVLTVSGPRLHITVRDQGIGIPRQELKHIYDPFFRASNTGKYNGYGIGLPLTRNIFRLHKGAIAVDSDAGTGTTVTLSLPLHT